jgi:hypothetical protein
MILNLSGQLSLLRVHDRGTKYGPPTDRIDAEVVVQFAGRPADAFGFQLRSDSNRPAREGMLGLLRDGFNHRWTVHIDYDIKAGKKNGRIIRTWLTKPPGGPTVITIGDALAHAASAKRATGAGKRAKKAAAKRSASG